MVSITDNLPRPERCYTSRATWPNGSTAGAIRACGPMANSPGEVAFDPRIARRFQWASTLNGLAFGLEISALPLYFLTLNLPPALYGLLVGTAWLVSLVV